MFFSHNKIKSATNRKQCGAQTWCNLLYCCRATFLAGNFWRELYPGVFVCHIPLCKERTLLGPLLFASVEKHIINTKQISKRMISLIVFLHLLFFQTQRNVCHLQTNLPFPFNAIIALSKSIMEKIILNTCRMTKKLKMILYFISVILKKSIL